MNSSTFVIDEFQLYPENAKFDFNRCLVYFGYVMNSLDLLPQSPEQISAPLSVSTSLIANQVSSSTPRSESSTHTPKTWRPSSCRGSLATQPFTLARHCPTHRGT